MIISEDSLKGFISRESEKWAMTSEAYGRIRREESVRDLGHGIKVLLQPWRVRSSAARTDAATIAARACFLCPENRLPGQNGIPAGNDVPFTILLNPYPVVEKHLTIVADTHMPQRFTPETAAYFAAMAFAWPTTTLFYNGSGSGASAPDHLHFQAIAGWRPEADEHLLAPHITVKAPTPEDAAQIIIDKLAELERDFGIDESMVNIASIPTTGGTPRILIFPRRRLRPDIYSADTGSDGMMVSPATLEMLGLIITPLKKDFDRIDLKTVEQIYREVGYDPRRRVIRVGIMSAPKIRFALKGGYSRSGFVMPDGEYAASVSADGRHVVFNGIESKRIRFAGGREFTLNDVTIGVDFHWQRQESQSFEGNLTLIPDGEGKVVAINEIDVESYLRSVISSEMSPTASIEFLKAHAVISRSWLYAQVMKDMRSRPTETKTVQEFTSNCEERVKWYDRDDHLLFDVCADDHCQRYQGIGRIVCENAVKAVESTTGEILTDQHGRICDARFSKCCGGKFEEFQYAWQPWRFDYLASMTDIEPQQSLPDLTDETAAKRWIESSPEAFCNCSDRNILGQVMNSYDLETADFYRWTVSYDSRRLGEIVRMKSGIDFGEISELIPVERGKSGRIFRLLIVGTKRSMIVGKELEIRKWLSESHLRSSAFTVEKHTEGDRCQFTLHGAGWGHGVGLCQIGAAVMSSRGYSYRSILKHYFPGSHVKVLE